MRKLKNSELERLMPKEYKKSKKAPITIVLDNIRSLNNIGSIFRTADAFKIEMIILCGITARPPHREIQKTALGATDTVEWQYFKTPEKTISYLKKYNFNIYPIEQTTKKIWLEEFYPEKEKIALIFGNEVKGVSNLFLKEAKNCIEIPQLGTKHSFNVAVSAGIVLWQVYKTVDFYK